MPEHRYRLLTSKDTMQKGDEVLNDDCETWNDLVGWEIGLPYIPSLYVPCRRPLALEDKPNG